MKARVFHSNTLQIIPGARPQAYAYNVDGKIAPYDGDYSDEDVIGIVEIPEPSDAPFELGKECPPKWNGVLVRPKVSGNN